MKDRFDKLESEVWRLSQSLRELESRIASLEGRSLPDGRTEAARQSGGEASPRPVLAPSERLGTTGALSLAGRLSIVMAGAYLLRALTEASRLTPVLGISLGLAYALLWLGAADRAAGKNLRWSSAFHGIAASLTAFPLIWEAVTRFRILRPPADSWLLAAFAAAFLTVACRRRFQVLAWFATLGSLATSVGLMFRTEEYVGSSYFLIAVGVATLWLGYELEWRGLRWPVAFAADLAVVCLTLRALAADPKDSPAAALTAQLTLLALYLATVAIRTIVRARNVIPFEVVQVIAAFLVGFIGAVTIARDTGFGTFILGGLGLLLGASAYAVAFAFVDRKAGHGSNFYFYTSLALLFSMSGSGLLLEGTALSLAWVLLAFLLKWLAGRSASFALVLHATACMVGAAIASRLFSYTYIAFAGAPALVGTNPTAAQLIVLAGAALCIGSSLQIKTDVGRIWHQTQHLVITIMLLGGIGGVAVSVIGRWMGGLPGGGVDAGILATLQTLVLALSALVLAWAGRRERLAEWGWLVYPLLAVTGLKILLQDFSRSRPATLFLALAVYGCVLILAPRLRRG
jgi:hypothetical protein